MTQHKSDMAAVGHHSLSLFCVYKSTQAWLIHPIKWDKHVSEDMEQLTAGGQHA